MDPMSGFDIRLVFTLPPRDFPCLTSLAKTPKTGKTQQFVKMKITKRKTLITLYHYNLISEIISSRNTARLGYFVHRQKTQDRAI